MQAPLHSMKFIPIIGALALWHYQFGNFGAKTSHNWIWDICPPKKARNSVDFNHISVTLIALQHRKFLHWLPLATLTMTNCSIFREEENNNCFWHINHSIQRIITSYIHSIKALNWKLTGRALCEKSFSCQSDALSFLLLTHKCNPSVPLRYLVHNTSVLCYNVQHCLQPINFCVTNIMWKVKDAITKYKI